MDAQLADAGDAIARWVEKGGRLLCFEQAFAGTVPWLPQMKLAGAEPLFWADVLADRHPIFEGIDGFERWLRWDGLAGVMCKTLIQPVNPSLLAVCAGNRGYGLVLSEVSLGKGIILNSQVLATERFGSDSVATQFVVNFLKYGLSREISAYATPFSAADLPVQRQLRLDIDHAGFVDLRPYVNQGFQDEYPGDRKGGWADCGTADMRNIPTGRQRFSLAWYDIINPAANGGKSCIVLAGRAIPGWERLYFPESVKSIKVGTKYKELFMLHTVMYATKEHAGKELFRYILHYEDGTTAVLPVIEGIDITDWHRPKDLPNALVAYQERRDALYISTWKNPYPDKRIETMDVVSAKLAVPIIVAISGRTY